jgi:hypothetical protein
MAWPSASHAAPPRVAASTREASRNDSASASLFSIGTRTSRSITSGCQTARLPILPVISSVV